MYDKLFKCINEAFRLLYENDSHLIYNWSFSDEKRDTKHHVGERSIVFRFAHYLQNLIIEEDELKEFNLDCEYNRNGAECKSLPSFPNGTFPDLIIHKRGSNDDNLLIMEFKTYWNIDRENDIRKIMEFVDINGEYRYKIGISVLIEQNRPKVAIIDANLVYAIDMYSKKEVSLGKAAEIAGRTKEDFIYYLGIKKVSIFDYESEEEFTEDIANA